MILRIQKLAQSVPTEFSTRDLNHLDQTTQGCTFGFVYQFSSINGITSDSAVFKAEVKRICKIRWVTHMRRASLAACSIDMCHREIQKVIQSTFSSAMPKCSRLSSKKIVARRGIPKYQNGGVREKLTKIKS